MLTTVRLTPESVYQIAAPNCKSMIAERLRAIAQQRWPRNLSEKNDVRDQKH